jgi:hypothetical protein
MARGWESKSVEAQIESAQRGDRNAGERRYSAEEARLVSARDGILLSRTRVRRDLENARSDRYRSLLQQALAKLDRDLAELESQLRSHGPGQRTG